MGALHLGIQLADGPPIYDTDVSTQDFRVSEPEEVSAEKLSCSCESARAVTEAEKFHSLLSALRSSRKADGVFLV